MLLRNCTSSHELDANALFGTFTHRKNLYDINARVISATYYSQLNKRSQLQLVSWVNKTRKNMSRLDANTSQPANNHYNSNWILFEQNSYVVKSLSQLYVNIWTELVICPVVLWFVVLCCLKEHCICHRRVHYHHLTFCRSAIVHSLHLCSVEMHSLAHFDTCVAFMVESKFSSYDLLTGKIFHRLFKVQMELC